MTRFAAEIPDAVHWYLQADTPIERIKSALSPPMTAIGMNDPVRKALDEIDPASRIIPFRPSSQPLCCIYMGLAIATNAGKRVADDEDSIYCRRDNFQKVSQIRLDAFQVAAIDKKVTGVLEALAFVFGGAHYYAYPNQCYVAGLQVRVSTQITSNLS